MTTPTPPGRGRRRRTPAWAKDGVALRDNATLKDIYDESQSRKHANRAQWVAIVLTALLSVGSIIATSAQTSAAEKIAAQERARDRDEKRVACTERYTASVFDVVFVYGKSAQSGSRVEPDVVLSTMHLAMNAAVSCVAAGMVVDEARARFGDALENVTNTTFSDDDQLAAIKELMYAMDGYMDVDVVALVDQFETPTRSE